MASLFEAIVLQNLSVLTRGVVIVDTHSKPSAARVIVDRLREITTKPVQSTQGPVWAECG